MAQRGLRIGCCNSALHHRSSACSAAPAVMFGTRQHTIINSYSTTSSIDFTDKGFLQSHLAKTMHFHLDADFDTVHGGYFQQLKREGAVLDQTNRHLCADDKAMQTIPNTDAVLENCRCLCCTVAISLTVQPTICR